MCRFENFSLNSTKPSYTLHYIPFIQTCLSKYFKYLQDDFTPPLVTQSDVVRYICDKFPFFWVILDYKKVFTGFVFLDNFIGNGQKLYSAELTTCFERKAWGSFTRYSAKIFLKKCFDELGLEKIKAQIYPENFRVKNLLKDCGFVHESTLKKETMRLGKPQDIEVYGLYRSYYYKQ